jgi:uncharacterized protein YkwD
MMTQSIAMFRRGAFRVVPILLSIALMGCGTQTPSGGNGQPAGSVLPTLTGGGTSASGDNSVLEQLHLERINRARLKPAAEAARFGIALNEGVTSTTITTASKQALAMNPTLTAVARAHSQDMLSRDYFEHNTPEGLSPFDRMQAAGYTYRAAGENLTWRGTTGQLDEISTANAQHQDLFVDVDYPNRGHRVVMLTADYKEVGIGVLRGTFSDNGRDYDSLMTTQDYGMRSNSPTFVLGVVYDDANRNGDYDVGEGTAGATVALGSNTTTTNSGGGYSFAVQPGQYTIRFPSGVQQQFNVGNSNIKIDCVSATQVLINLGLGPI